MTAYLIYNTGLKKVYIKWYKPQYQKGSSTSYNQPPYQV